jgi:hypothetical protein
MGVSGLDRRVRVRFRGEWQRWDRMVLSVLRLEISRDAREARDMQRGPTGCSDGPSMTTPAGAQRRRALCADARDCVGQQPR